MIYCPFDRVMKENFSDIDKILEKENFAIHTANLFYDCFDFCFNHTFKGIERSGNDK